MSLPPGVATLAKANCAQCPLREALVKAQDWKPVPAEINEGSRTLLLANSPCKRDTELKIPYTGEFGAATMDILKENGVERKQASYSFVVACRYPNDRPDEFLGRLKATNRRRVRAKQDPLPTPEMCCAPRLEAELELHDNVVSFGSEALKAVGVDRTLRASNPKLRDFRGFPTVTRVENSRGPLKLLAAPERVAYEPKWAPVMAMDVAKGFRYFAGQLNWSPPNKIYKPSIEVVKKFCAQIRAKKRDLVFDVETSPYTSDANGDPLYDAQLDPLRCIGVYGHGGPGHGVALVIPVSPIKPSLGFRKRDGSPWFDPYSPGELAAIFAEIADLLRDPDVLKIGHNANVYDRMVCENHLGVTPFPVFDTLPAGKLGMSEYPKSLSFYASIDTDSPPWKAEHAGSEAQTDEELFDYNGNDLGNNSKIVPAIRQRAAVAKQDHLLPTYYDLQDACVGMHKLGLKIDETRRLEHKQRLEEEASKWYVEVAKIAKDAGLTDYNPRSPTQTSRLFYEIWDLPVQEYTKTGEPSTNDASNRKLLGHPLVGDEQKAFIKAFRKYNKYDHLLNNYIDKWVPGGPYVGLDGWIHPDFNATGTVGWRASSSSPNFQNVKGEYLVDWEPAEFDDNGKKLPGRPLGFDFVKGKLKPNGTHVLPSGLPEGRWNLRDMFVAPDGKSFVAADMDALELCLAAAIAGADYYLKAKTDGTIDPHNLTGQMIFGPAYWEQEGAPSNPKEKGEGAFYRRRTLVKIFFFAALYGAGPNMIQEIVSKAENDYGELIFADITEAEIRRMHRRWKTSAPEFPQWWERTLNEFRQQGYLADPVWGLRRYFANGENLNEILNYKIQTGGAAIVHMGMFKLIRGAGAPLPFDFDKKTGLCLQVHDSLMFMVQEHRAKEYAEIIQEAMKVDVPGIPITFTAEAKIAQRWSKT